MNLKLHINHIFLVLCKNARISSPTYPCEAKGENGEKEEGNEHKKDSLVQPKKDYVFSIPASSSSSFPYSSPKGITTIIIKFQSLNILFLISIYKIF